MHLFIAVKQGFNERLPRSPLSTERHPTSPIIKSASTPASLQTIVRFQNGSNMSLQHKVSNAICDRIRARGQESDNGRCVHH